MFRSPEACWRLKQWDLSKQLGIFYSYSLWSRIYPQSGKVMFSVLFIQQCIDLLQIHRLSLRRRVLTVLGVCVTERLLAVCVAVMVVDFARIRSLILFNAELMVWGRTTQRETKDNECNQRVFFSTNCDHLIIQTVWLQLLKKRNTENWIEFIEVHNLLSAKRSRKSVGNLPSANCWVFHCILLNVIDILNK